MFGEQPLIFYTRTYPEETIVAMFACSCPVVKGELAQPLVLCTLLCHGYYCSALSLSMYIIRASSYEYRKSYGRISHC